MAEYECFPLWQEAPKGVTNLAPDALGLPADLIASLKAWAQAYESTYDASDPASSGFQNQAAEQEFYSHGLVLAKRVAEALGGVVQVRYFDGRVRHAYLV